MKKSFVGALALLSSVVLVACSNGTGTSSPDTVLTSDAGTITKDQLYTALKSQAGSATLQRLVMVQVLEKDAGDQKDTLKKEADTEVATQMTQYGGEEGLTSILKQSGFASIDMYKETVYLNKLINAAVKKATTFTDAEVQAHYDAWQPKITVQHILIASKATDDPAVIAAAKQKAVDLIGQLNGGADFATLAKENSDDTGSKENGGTIGPFSHDEMVTPFSDAAYALANVGDYTKEPVQTDYGFHIIKLTDKPAKEALDKVRATMEEEMLNEKLKDSAYIHSIVGKLIQEANIKINDEDLKDALAEFLPADAGAASSSEAASSSSEASSSN